MSGHCCSKRVDSRQRERPLDRVTHTAALGPGPRAFQGKQSDWVSLSIRTRKSPHFRLDECADDG